MQPVADQVANLKAAIFANLNGLDGQMTQFQVKSNPTLKKSECWQKFGHVHTLQGDIVQIQGTCFVACFVCHTVYTFKSKNGTSTIMGHKCPHERETISDEKKEIKRKPKNPELDALKREITKALLEDDVLKGYTLLSNPNATKSDCWKRFGHVYHHGTLMEAFDSGFVACYGCKVVYQYKVRNGTSTMTTHTCLAVKEDFENEARKGMKRTASYDTKGHPSFMQHGKRLKDGDTIDITPKKALEVLKQTITASLLTEREQSPFELRPNTNESKAECWQRFGFVYRHGTLLIDHGSQFVACFDCKAVYQFKSKNGTSSLLSHTCAMRKANEKIKQTLHHELMQFCITDAMPLSIMECCGFKSLWITLMELSKTSHSLDRWTPDSDVVYQLIQSQYLALRLALHQKILPLVQEGLHFGVSYSKWTSASSVSFVGIMIHCIDGDYILHDRLLDIHTIYGPVAFAQIHQSLVEIGLPHVTILSENDEMPSEWSTLYPRHNGYASTVLQRVLDGIIRCAEENVHAQGDERPMYSVLRLAHRFILANGSGSITHGSNVMTWHNLVRAIQFIHSNWQIRQDIWLQHASSDMLPEDGHANVVETLLGFFVLFLSAAQAFEKSHVPTLHVVCYWRHALKQHCRELDGNDDILRSLKVAAMNQLDQWQLSTLHVMAALVDPGQRKRLGKFGVSSTEIDQAKTELRALMVEALPQVKSKVSNTSIEKKTTTRTTPTSILSMYGDSDDEMSDESKSLDIDAELGRYFDSASFEDTAPDINLLSWWKWQAKRWPLLSRAVRSILCFPASPKLDEMTRKHRGLHSSSGAREILFLHSNRDLKASPSSGFVI